MMKKVFALCAIVLVLAVGILPAFALDFSPPEFPNQTLTNLARPSRADAQNIVQIVTDMKTGGALNTFRPMFIRTFSNSGEIALYCCQSVYAPTVDLSGTNASFGNMGVYQFRLSAGGFAFSGYLGAGVTVPSADIFVTFAHAGGSTTASLNVAYEYGAGDPQTAITAIKDYWATFVGRLENDPSVALQQAYDEGLRVGYDNGKADGYDEGFFWGKDEGFNDGYYQATEASKPLIDRAYDEGYAEGEADGYLAGKRDQATEQSALIDIPAIFDGLFNGANSILHGFDINLFGVNIVGVLVAIVVITVVAFVIRKLWK